ncbi:MAG TPA: ABC transporter permease [Chitinophagaceae bacterium]|nr:ABC transporter permease [Chitinophagaceae bacterium]MCC6635167.1 ABC transporter permease [Chitinophagaceae bacterium]HMZ46881.1 ABC transporter permease [Chitinophagaceae bacterium]HNM33380.1 ABC transporter permease [Chitinophagaceae bacterium]HNN31367.1 ABC transporter permease [Chitinophagaceae bacterium]
MTFKDTFLISFRTVRSNKLRTGITVAIIAFGIMALMGIITAIQAMEHSLRESFSFMGSNAFSIRHKELTVRMGGPNNESTKHDKRKVKEKKSNLNKVITKEEAEYFKNNLHYPAQVSIYRRGGGSLECSYDNKKTNPITTLFGGDENYLAVNGYTIVAGRNLNSIDVNTGRSVCLIGSNTAKTLFGSNPERSIDKIIRVAGLPYRVIGLLKEKGSSGFLRQDDVVITSYVNVSKLSTASSSFLIGVMVKNVSEIEVAQDEAIAAFRSVRKLHPAEADNFAIEKSDRIAEMFIGFLSGISGSAGAIGMITLIGAAIGLMNIMLVAVNERTREVGLIKAIGGKSKNVRMQFLMESMIISLMGAAFGIVLGVLIGNIFAAFLKTGFIIPWNWVFAGVLICTVVGLLAGLYPAQKASKLNPIDALRYE